MTKHFHADAMLEYAQDAQQSDAPFLFWQVSHRKEDNWCDLDFHPTWGQDFRFRRKPQVLCINGIQVPPPAQKELQLNEYYWVPALAELELFEQCIWENDVEDFTFLSRGIVHTSRHAAVAHALALTSNTNLLNSQSGHDKIKREADKVLVPVEFINEVRRSGDTRLASMAIAVLNSITKKGL